MIRGNLLTVLGSIDPMEIIYSTERNIVTGIPGIRVGELGIIFRSIGLIVALCMVAASFTVLLFVDKPEAVSEKKKDIYHKLAIVVLLTSAVFIFNQLKEFFDYFFQI